MFPLSYFNSFSSLLLVSSLVISSVWINGWQTTSSAQGIFDARMQMGNAEFLPPPRNLRQVVREAEEAIQAERYSDAVVRLGDLLIRSDDKPSAEPVQDYLFQLDLGDEGEVDLAELQRMSETEQRAFMEARLPQSYLKHVRDLIGDLPSAGLDTYELRYGPLAAKLLRDAGPDRNWGQVERVRREFFHTQAGYQASQMLALREWSLGNPLACSILLDDLVSRRRVIDELGDSIVVLHAIACQRAGRPLPTPLQYPSDFTAKVSKDSEAEDAEVRAARWNDWVRSKCEGDTLSMDLIAENYPVLGGGTDRNGFSTGQMPLSNPRWKVESSDSPRQERMIEKQTQQWKAAGQLPPPSWMPLRVGDQLLMRTTERLFGVNYRTGKRVWQYPWFSPPESAIDANDFDPMEEEEDPVDLLAQRVWNDVPFGQLSSDGERVFMIDDLDKIEIQRISPFGSRRVRSNANTLVALDLATEGKLLWRLGKSETSPTELSEAFFLGPPLPLRGNLYVLAEIAGEIHLVCLNPANGSVQWRQVLVAVESGGIGMDPVRRVAGAMLTYHEGVLICPTGAGATVGIDLIDRTIRWGNQIPRNQEFVRSVYRPRADVSMNQLSQRWLHSLAIADGDSVLLTPIESDRLQVVDLLTGRNRFSPQNRIRLLYVAGIRDDRFLVVGGDEVSAKSLKDGSEIWSTPPDLVRPGQRVSGRGVFGVDRYYLPTTTDELIEISLATGEVLNRRTVRFPLGNLVAVDGELVSQSTTTVAVAYGEKSLQPRVEELLKQDPDDFFALVRKAELLIEQGSRTEALRLLDRARSLDPDNDEVVMLSVEAMLGTLRRNPASKAVDLDALIKLIDQPEQRAELLVLQIQGLLQNSTDADARRKAMDLLIDLSGLVLQQPKLNRDTDAVFPNATRQFTLDDWIAARVAQLVSASAGSELESLNESVARLISTRMNLDSVGLTRTLKHFASLTSATRSLRTDLAARALQLDDPLLAERLAWGETPTRDDRLATLDDDRLLTLAKLYSQVRWNLDRLSVGEVLTRRMEESASEESESFTDDWLASNPVIGRSYETAAQWPREVELDWTSQRLPRSAPMFGDRNYANLTHLMGRQMRGWKVMSDNMNPLALINPYGIHRGLPIEGLSGRTSSKELTCSGGLMFVLTQSELIAIDLFRAFGGQGDDPVRWRRSLGGDGQAVAKRRSVSTPFGNPIYHHLMIASTAENADSRLVLGPVLGDRLFLLQGLEVICLDTVTGQERWRATSDTIGCGLVLGDDRVVVVGEKQKRLASYDLHDGSLIDTTPREMGSVITSLGSHVLTVTQLGAGSISRPDASPELKADLAAVEDMFDPQLLELIDVATGKTLLHRVADSHNRTDINRAAAYAQLTDGRYFTLLDHVGRTTVWDLLTGESIADVEVPTEPGLFSVSVMVIQDQILVMPRHRKPELDMGSRRTLAVSGGAAVRPITAMHAISTVDGALRWSRSFDDSWGCTIEQPWVTPMLILARAHLNLPGNGIRRREMDVMCVSATDGKTIHEIERREINGSGNGIESRVKLLPHLNQKTAIVEIQMELLRYTFSETGEGESQPTKPMVPSTNDLDQADDLDQDAVEPLEPIRP